MPKKKTQEQLRSEIMRKCDFLDKQMKEVRRIEDRFRVTKAQLIDLCARYNQQRLQELIAVLVERGLAFCPRCERLVRESDFTFYEESGTRVRTRNQYYDYEEPYHYKSYRCGRCNKGINGDGTKREGWTTEFIEMFATKRNHDLPSELLLLLEKDQLPDEPINVNDWIDFGSRLKHRFERVKFFYVTGPGLDIHCWTVEPKK